jgi:hypothetical protein
LLEVGDSRGESWSLCNSRFLSLVIDWQFVHPNNKRRVEMLRSEPWRETNFAKLEIPEHSAKKLVCFVTDVKENLHD